LHNKTIMADLLLLTVAAIWGWTFVTVKDALGGITPFYFNAIRFTVAALLFLPFTAKGPMGRDTWRAGLVIGLLLWGGYSLQTLGLVYTSAANAGFITGLSVVFVPVLVTIQQRQLPSWSTTTGVFCATAGLALLTVQPGFRLNPGDLLVFGCALSFAGHIFTVGRYSRHHPTLPLVAIQLMAVAAASWLAAGMTEPLPTGIKSDVAIAIAITAVLATALAFWVQNWAQRFTTPVRTAIIFSSEPVFAALFAYWLGGEYLGPRALLGGTMVLAGMLVAELGPAPNQKGGNIPAQGQ